MILISSYILKALFLTKAVIDRQVRYGPYAPMALNITRDLLLSSRTYLTAEGIPDKVKDKSAKHLLQNAAHVADLYRAVGNRSFSITVPCHGYFQSLMQSTTSNCPLTLTLLAPLYEIEF